MTPSKPEADARAAMPGGRFTIAFALPAPLVLGALVLGALVVGALSLGTAPAFSQEPGHSKAEREHAVVFELGGAGDWGLTGGPSSQGGTVAAEATPIERWLELEAGVTALGTNGRREVATDLLFKKPFSLSPTVEFMAGIGPELSWRLGPRPHRRSLATEIALDFMFWPTTNVGWYVEPSYSIAGLRSTSDRSLGVTAGLLIGVPWRRTGASDRIQRTSVHRDTRP